MSGTLCLGLWGWDLVGTLGRWMGGANGCVGRWGWVVLAGLVCAWCAGGVADMVAWVSSGLLGEIAGRSVGWGALFLSRCDGPEGWHGDWCCKVLSG